MRGSQCKRHEYPLMSIPLSSIRTLDTLATPGGVFKLLAVDHRGSMRRVLAPEDPDGVAVADVQRAKEEIVGELSPYASGVMANPGFAAACVYSGALSGSASLIVTSESDGYTAVARGEPARLIDGWALDRARELGAAAVKILVQQPIGSPELRRLDREFVLEVSVACRELDLCLVLEVLVPDGHAGRVGVWRDALVGAACDLSPHCDLYKTSFPGIGEDPEQGRGACAQISAEAAVPWVVLSGGAPPERFAQQLEIACQEGASGFLAGRSVWADAVAVAPANRRMQLRQVAAVRLRRYGSIVDRFARPWRERFASLLGPESAPSDLCLTGTDVAAVDSR